MPPYKPFMPQTNYIPTVGVTMPIPRGLPTQAPRPISYPMHTSIPSGSGSIHLVRPLRPPMPQMPNYGIPPMVPFPPSSGNMPPPMVNTVAQSTMTEDAMRTLLQELGRGAAASVIHITFGSETTNSYLSALK